MVFVIILVMVKSDETCKPARLVSYAFFYTTLKFGEKLGRFGKKSLPNVRR